MLHSQILALHWRPGVVTSFIVTVAFAYAPRRPRPEDRATDGWGLLPRWRFSQGQRGQHSPDDSTLRRRGTRFFSVFPQLTLSLVVSSLRRGHRGRQRRRRWSLDLKAREGDREGWFRLDGVDYKFITYLPTRSSSLLLSIDRRSPTSCPACMPPCLPLSGSVLFVLFGLFSKKENTDCNFWLYSTKFLEIFHGNTRRRCSLNYWGELRCNFHKILGR